MQAFEEVRAVRSVETRSLKRPFTPTTLLGAVLISCMLCPVSGIGQSVKSVTKVPRQMIEVVSGNITDFKGAGRFLVQFDYSDLMVGGYDNEQAFIEYMREDARLRHKDPDDWEQTWRSNRSSVFEPKFLELFREYAGNKIELDVAGAETDHIMELHTQFVEIGFNRNFTQSPTYMNVLVTLKSRSGNVEPLVISMKYVIGAEVMSSYSADFRRIEEAYAKCGKELAAFIRKKVL